MGSGANEYMNMAEMETKMADLEKELALLKVKHAAMQQKKRALLMLDDGASSEFMDPDVHNHQTSAERRHRTKSSKTKSDGADLSDSDNKPLRANSRAPGLAR